MKRLFAATRPKFYPASILPVLAGSAWGFAAAGRFDAMLFALAFVATLLVHAGANVLNDVGDDAGGTDRCNDDRIYPYTGGSQFIQAGIMSRQGMTWLGAGLLLVAALLGLALIAMRGPVVLAFGITGVLLAVLYSIGPVRLSGLGVGEAAVGVGFGVVPVTGAAWLQSGTIDMNLLLFSFPISLWVTAILLANEIPDVQADAATGKRTLPVRIGLPMAAALYLTIHTAAAAIVVLLAWRGALPLWAATVPLLALLPAAKAAAAIRAGVAERARMTKAIEATLGIHTVGSIWLCAVALFVAFAGGA